MAKRDKGVRILDERTRQPIEAPEVLVRPSPIPRSLTIIVIMLAAFSIAYTVWEQRARLDAANKQAVLNDHFKKDIQQQVNDAQEDRDRLRRLVERVVKAKSAEESKQALERFLSEQRSADAARRRRDAAERQGDTRSPSSSPQTGPSASRSPSRSPGPSPSPTKSRSPTPSQSSLVPCLQVKCITSLIPTLPAMVRTVSVADTGSSGGSMHLAPEVVARLLGLLVSLLVAVATKKYASSTVKATLNVALAAVLGALSVLVTANGHYDVSAFINAALNTFVVDIAAYYGLYKPAGIADAVQHKTRKVGVGSSTRHPASAESTRQDSATSRRKRH